VCTLASDKRLFRHLVLRLQSGCAQSSWGATRATCPRLRSGILTKTPPLRLFDISPPPVSFKRALQRLINRYGYICLAQVPERVLTKTFVVLIIGNSKSFHLGVQGTFKLSPPSVFLRSGEAALMRRVRGERPARPSHFRARARAAGE